MNAISAGCSFWPNCDGFCAERSGCNGLRTLRESAVLGNGFKYVWCLRRSNGLGLLMAGARAVGTKKGALNQSERLLIIPLSRHLSVNDCHYDGGVLSRFDESVS
jgi:hypothetical protein